MLPVKAPISIYVVNRLEDSTSIHTPGIPFLQFWPLDKRDICQLANIQQPSRQRQLCHPGDAFHIYNFAVSTNKSASARRLYKTPPLDLKQLTPSSPEQNGSNTYRNACTRAVDKHLQSNVAEDCMYHEFRFCYMLLLLHTECHKEQLNLL